MVKRKSKEENQHNMMKTRTNSKKNKFARNSSRRLCRISSFDDQTDILEWLTKRKIRSNLDLGVDEDNALSHINASNSSSSEWHSNDDEDSKDSTELTLDNSNSNEVDNNDHNNVNTSMPSLCDYEDVRKK